MSEASNAPIQKRFHHLLLFLPSPSFLPPNHINLPSTSLLNLPKPLHSINNDSRFCSRRCSRYVSPFSLSDSQRRRRTSSPPPSPLECSPAAQPISLLPFSARSLRFSFSFPLSLESIDAHIQYWQQNSSEGEKVCMSPRHLPISPPPDSLLLAVSLSSAISLSGNLVSLSGSSSPTSKKSRLSCSTHRRAPSLPVDSSSCGLAHPSLLCSLCLS